MTNQFILQFELDNALFDRPKLFYDFVFLTRSVVLSKKEYPSFERFVLHPHCVFTTRLCDNNATA